MGTLPTSKYEKRLTKDLEHVRRMQKQQPSADVIVKEEVTDSPPCKGRIFMQY